MTPTQKDEGPVSHLCHWRRVKTFDNAARPWIHPPDKIFKKYVRPGMQVMDAGCGAGFASIGLARMVGDGGRVTAVDVQSEMLEMVRRRAESAGLADRIILHKCSQNDLGLAEPFDFINAFWMVHELPDQAGFMRQIHQALKPGGRFFVAEPMIHVSEKRFQSMIETAASAGLVVSDRPRILLSRAVVFSKNGA